MIYFTWTSDDVEARHEIDQCKSAFGLSDVVG